MFQTRLAHYAILTIVMLAVTLPNLGGPSLWDVDEGVNAGCTREMMECGTWVVPTFNGELRTAKPIMLYWIQRVSFNAFGVNEWAARFPAVLLGLGTVLLSYELARRMFDAATGLLSGIALATAIEFCKLSHAATPDAPLIFFITLTLYLFWIGHENGGRAWMYTAAIASGFAALTKGPIGLGLPGLIVLLYFAWNRELSRLRDWRLVRGILLWCLIAVPWYVLVIAETRGAYLTFFRKDNAGRFLNPMEGHGGPIVYYVGAVFAFFAPWCAFLCGAVWYAVKGALPRTPSSVGGLPMADVRAYRFLLCWVACYLVVFSAAATKLPNYIGPLYPAVAILTARFLIRWRTGDIVLPRWVMPAATGGVAFVGALFLFGFLITSGTLNLNIKGQTIMPGLAKWSPIGGILIVAAVGMAWFLAKNQRLQYVRTLTAATVLFIGAIAAFVHGEFDAYKPPKLLVADSGAKQLDREIRIGSLEYPQPSLSFYAERKIERLRNANDVMTFLAMPLPAYVFLPAREWEAYLENKVTVPHRVVARRFDFLRNRDILVVTNQ